MIDKNFLCEIQFPQRLNGLLKLKMIKMNKMSANITT